MLLLLKPRRQLLYLDCVRLFRRASSPLVRQPRRLGLDLAGGLGGGPGPSSGLRGHLLQRGGPLLGAGDVRGGRGQRSTRRRRLRLRGQPADDCLRRLYADTARYNSGVNRSILVYYGMTKCRPTTRSNKKLSYRRGTARRLVSVEILPVATQQCRNYLYDKS